MSLKDTLWKIIRINRHSYAQVDKMPLENMPRREFNRRKERNNAGFLSNEKFRENYQKWEEKHPEYRNK